jgi:hypothetical protein
MPKPRAQMMALVPNLVAQYSMRIFERVFPGREARTALQSIAQLERTLPDSLGPQIFVGVIKTKLRQRIVQNPDELRATMRATRYSVEVIVLILARNIAWDELASGNHTVFGTRTTMTGSGLIALHSHLTTLLQKKGAETSEEAAASRASLRDMIKLNFGFQ